VIFGNLTLIEMRHVGLDPDQEPEVLASLRVPGNGEAAHVQKVEEQPFFRRFSNTFVKGAPVLRASCINSLSSVDMLQFWFSSLQLLPTRSKCEYPVIFSNSVETAMSGQSFVRGSPMDTQNLESAIASRMVDLMSLELHSSAAALSISIV